MTLVPFAMLVGSLLGKKEIENETITILSSSGKEFILPIQAKEFSSVMKKSLENSSEGKTKILKYLKYCISFKDKNVKEVSPFELHIDVGN